MFAEGDILIANFGLHHGSSTVSLPAQGAEAGSCDGCNEQPFSHACPCALYLPCLPLIAGRKLVLSARSTKRCLKALPPITSRMSAVCHGHSGSRRLRSTLTHPTVNTTEASRPSSATPSGASSSCRRAELGPHSLGAAPWARKLGHYLLRCARWRHAACRLQRKQPIICHLPSPSPCVSAFAAQGNGTMELEPGFTDKYGLQQGLWRNKAADAVMRSAGIPLIQSFNESVPMWRAHRDNGQGYECTHPCHPSLSQASLGGGGGRARGAEVLGANPRVAAGSAGLLCLSMLEAARGALLWKARHPRCASSASSLPVWLTLRPPLLHSASLKQFMHCLGMFGKPCGVSACQRTAGFVPPTQTVLLCPACCAHRTAPVSFAELPADFGGQVLPCTGGSCVSVSGASRRRH